MPEFIIEGGRTLNGEVNLQGAKNSVLPILAATILCEGESVIHNCPRISDVDIALEILNYLGCKTKFTGSDIIVNASNVERYDIPESFMRKMRSSIIFLGALISRIGKADLSLPGGCDLGPRPVDMHFMGLRQLGLNLEERHGRIKCDSVRGITGCNIALSFPSVGATENLILAAVKSKGTTVITNAAREPEIEDLADYLNSCGAKIRGAGEGVIQIEGVKKLYASEHTIIPDRIAAVTYMAAASVTAGTVFINDVNITHLSSVIPVFEEMGCIIDFPMKNSLRLKAPGRLIASKFIRTMPYPGFPTDAQALVMPMLCVAEGTGVIVESIFESRYKHVGELLRLGADVKVEGCTAVIRGVKRLSGAEVKAADLRGAASLVIAGLCAEGVTKINRIGYIDRGYDDIEGNLNKIGAYVKRI